jgi:hypothetical protein
MIELDPQEVYETVFNTLLKLPEADLLKGARCFELNGLRIGVLYSQGCFLTMLLNDEVEDFSFRNLFSMEALAHKRYPNIKSSELAFLSSTHFEMPEILFLAVSEILGG